MGFPVDVLLAVVFQWARYSVWYCRWSLCDVSFPLFSLVVVMLVDWAYLFICVSSWMVTSLARLRNFATDGMAGSLPWARRSFMFSPAVG